MGFESRPLVRTDRARPPGGPFLLLALGLLPAAPVGATTDLLLENEAVRTVVNTYVPGETTGEHTHLRPRFVFVIGAGTLQSTDPDGVVTPNEVTALSCLYAAPQTHTLRNVGATTVSLLEVELKHGTGPAGPTQACVPSEEKSDGTPAGNAKRGPRRTILLSGPDLIAARIDLPAGTRLRSDRERGDRLIYVLRGGPLETVQTNGRKATATQGAALWIAGGAPLAASGKAAVVIEIEPAGGP